MTKNLEQTFLDTLNEKQKRLYAGLRANALGYYGVAQVSQELGIHRHTVRAGQKQLARLQTGHEVPSSRIRRVGGGRKKSHQPARTTSSL